MTIMLEETPLVSDLSIFAQVGKNTALDVFGDVVVQDGILNVKFIKAAGSGKEPVVSAISVYRKNP
jgi:hypothetical protein